MPLSVTPADLRTFVLEDPLCKRLAALAGDTPVALVGGWVRDRLLGRGAPDWDLVMPGDPLPFVRALAEADRGPVVTLDAGFGIYRTRLRGGLELDVAKAVGGAIEADLGRRDLTINAMAVRLRDGALLDPVGGLADLEAGVVRAPARANMEDDPLRLVRVHRFAATLGFAVDPATAAWSRELAPRLARSAGERILAELGKLLKAPAGPRELAAMAASGVLAQCLGGEPPAGAVGRATALAAALGPWPWLDQPLAAERTRRVAALLGALLRGGKTDAAAARLRWSRPEDRLLAAIAGHPLPDDPSPRAVHRFLKSAGDAAPILAAMAPGPAADAVIAAFFDRLEHPLPRLVDGNDLMRRLGLPPGPGIARLLAEIEEAQALGEVRDPEEALAWAARKGSTGEY